MLTKAEKVKLEKLIETAFEAAEALQHELTAYSTKIVVTKSKDYYRSAADLWKFIDEEL